ncbi:hypothetical protein RIF29_27686 [Crotalaria pallida]|uniref:C2H2-type domain-containing protein n=1 Tax=Crotalaria pallida TaxID=3830 RepID=A0AAN9EPI6_CROPI
MPEEPLSLHSNMASTFIQVHDSNPNPNSNPNSNPIKKKRNLPGNPDPDAEVIALSPKSLMATNRFVCEICKKGFQRDQNLQLHRRGHNLPWKLKQRNKQDVIRKKVYVCPEKSCVHNDPCRALGDLTGIKKHFSRKHGEKKWKCNKCSKKYAVQSDWKAHSKICGTREYKCECGTIFSRRDSFITHRAFCGALAEQSARIITSVPAVLCDFRSNNHLINNTHQLASRIPITEFHQEFGGSGTEPLMGNFVDAEHVQKLRLPLWLDQANSHHQLQQHPFGVTSNNSNELVQTTMNMNMNLNMFGSSSQQQHAQFLNYRYQETTPSFTNANLSLPIAAATAMSQGLKQEQEENKGNLLSHHGVSSLYSCDQNLQGGSGGPTHHMSSTIQMESTRVNDNNNVFGMLQGSTNNNNNNNNNISESQKFFKQVNIQQSDHNFNNHMVVSSINDASSSSFGNLDHMVMPVVDDEEQLGLTRDFLGVGDNEALRTPFLQQDLAKFNPIS